MRLPRPQFAVRRMMIIVAGCAVVAWLVLAAIELKSLPDTTGSVPRQPRFSAISRTSIRRFANRHYPARIPMAIG